MSSKAIKPKIRIGQSAASRRRAQMIWTLLALCGAGGAYAAYNYGAKTTVEVPVAKVRRAEFVIGVRTRGEVRSIHSTSLAAPQVPEVRIVKLAESGKPVRKGDVVVEFDAAQLDQQLLEKTTGVRTVDSEVTQTKASHRITTEMDAMNLMQSQYNVERSKLEASKAEVVSQIEGEKSRIDVGISEGELAQVQTTMASHKVSASADLERLGQKKDKAVRDTERTKNYLSHMVLRAPNDGIVNILPNFRAQGSFGQSPPPFKEGDRAWTGALIAEIPDLSSMRIEFKLEEVDRGRIQLGQKIRIRVDAIPEKEFNAEMDWISPIASLNFKGFGPPEKAFPAQATLKNLDPRLRPGMSATAEIVIENQPNALLIPAKASFMHNGKPAVYVQQGQGFSLREIQVGKRNDTDIVVLSGLREGELVTTENPIEAAKKAKKL